MSFSNEHYGPAAAAATTTTTAAAAAAHFDEIRSCSFRCVIATINHVSDWRDAVKFHSKANVSQLNALARSGSSFSGRKAKFSLSKHSRQ